VQDKNKDDEDYEADEEKDFLRSPRGKETENDDIIVINDVKSPLKRTNTITTQTTPESLKELDYQEIIKQKKSGSKESKFKEIDSDDEPEIPLILTRKRRSSGVMIVEPVEASLVLQYTPHGDQSFNFDLTQPLESQTTSTDKSAQQYKEKESEQREDEVENEEEKIPELKKNEGIATVPVRLRFPTGLVTKQLKESIQLGELRLQIAQVREIPITLPLSSAKSSYHIST